MTKNNALDFDKKIKGMDKRSHQFLIIYDHFISNNEAAIGVLSG
ncbi:MAG: hypothetical protein RBT01_10085 [Anaerolineaceae bacterium]|jgi:hypothetical protein|nr:hypothetical protein [Anaerolineaceae bacterium]